MDPCCCWSVPKGTKTIAILNMVLALLVTVTGFCFLIAGCFEVAHAVNETEKASVDKKDSPDIGPGIMVLFISFIFLLSGLSALIMGTFIIIGTNKAFKEHIKQSQLLGEVQRDQTPDKKSLEETSSNLTSCE